MYANKTKSWRRQLACRRKISPRSSEASVAMISKHRLAYASTMPLYEHLSFASMYYLLTFFYDSIFQNRIGAHLRMTARSIAAFNDARGRRKLFLLFSKKSFEARRPYLTFVAFLLSSLSLLPLPPPPFLPSSSSLLTISKRRRARHTGLSVNSETGLHN